MKIGILGNFNKYEFYDIFNELTDFLKSNNINFYLLENNRLDQSKLSKSECIRDFQYIADNVDIVLSIGGDGTIISTIRKFIKYNKPILGLHIGGLGFLAECNKDNYKDKILDIKNNKYHIEKRMLLNVSLKKEKINYDIINELVIDRRSSARTIKTHVTISERFANTYESDGIIFSTPTGSTAYSLSAGGPIVSPDIEVIIITPICPHTLSMRPIIIPSNDIVGIEFEDFNDNNLSLTVDGQIQEIIAKNSKVLLKKSDYSAYLVKFENDNYFQTLRNKMFWKGNLRIK